MLATYRSAPVATAPGGAELAALTAREREVLALIGSGKTNTEIASALFVSEGTVKTHVNHVFAKLGLRDRAAAVIFAFDHNLTSQAPLGGPGRARARKAGSYRCRTVNAAIAVIQARICTFTFRPGRLAGPRPGRRGRVSRGRRRPAG